MIRGVSPCRPGAGTALACGLLLAGALAGCARAVPNRDPVGESFPPVAGRALDGTAWQLPGDLRGGPAILLVGYEQDAQFDIDRWLIGLDMYRVRTPVLEVPTIEGLVPGLFAGSIDAGMRSGIPEDIWTAVVTVYDDAGRIRAFTGTERPNAARVLLLDAAGTVVFFHDEGFSVPALRRLLEQLPVDDWQPEPG